MTPYEIANRLKFFKRKEVEYSKWSVQEAEKVGDAIVTTHPPSAASPYPSANRNGVHYFGCGTTVSQADLLRVLNTLKAARTELFFFWLSPCPQQEDIAAWLLENGLKPFQGTQYPTLTRPVEEVAPHDTHLRVERVSRREVQDCADAITHIYNAWGCPFFFDSVDQPGFDHFLAYEDCTPVSAAILGTHGDVAYLGWAATAEEHRGKGGQNALITARLNRAAELGCRIACSETLAMLKTSLGNLERNGFEIVYEKQVFVWES